MRIDIKHFEESGPGFDYKYNVYELYMPDRTYVARSYDDEPNQAHFLRKEADCEMLAISESDIKSSEFRDAVEQL